MKRYDAVIVGARVAGAALATQLARGGMDVVMVDRATFPSEALSTNLIWPNGVAELDRIGALDQLCERHAVPELQPRFRILGHEIAGSLTSVDGFDYAIAPRRLALDAALVDTALAAGAEGRFGRKVVGLLGDGTERRPAHGVRLEDGERIEADRVLGADGRASRVAGALGLDKRDRLEAGMAYLLATWTGLPPSGEALLELATDRALWWFPGEDGTHLLVLGGLPDLSHGGAAERKRRYLERLRSFPDSLDAAELDGARLVSRVRAAPETLMRGYYRDPSGPGWALVGDAGHFKHPATGQGIGDALAQASYVAGDLLAGGGLEGYERWRDDRSDDHYAWSFTLAQWPTEEIAGPIYAGMARDEDAAQDFRDSFSRLVPTREMMSGERLSRWFGAAGSPAA